MSKMAELLKKQEEIFAQIEAEKNKGRDEALHNVREAIKAYGCLRRLNIDPPCRSNIDPGRVANF
jgi:hypothetical protein